MEIAIINIPYLNLKVVYCAVCMRTVSTANKPMYTHNDAGKPELKCADEKMRKKHKSRLSMSKQTRLADVARRAYRDPKCAEGNMAAHYA
ncbi:hypothetical protein D3C84_972170 [compost metagenome]